MSWKLPRTPVYAPLVQSVRSTAICCSKMAPCFSNGIPACRYPPSFHLMNRARGGSAAQEQVDLGRLLGQQTRSGAGGLIRMEVAKAMSCNWPGRRTWSRARGTCRLSCRGGRGRRAPSCRRRARGRTRQGGCSRGPRRPAPRRGRRPGPRPRTRGKITPTSMGRRLPCSWAVVRPGPESDGLISVVSVKVRIFVEPRWAPMDEQQLRMAQAAEAVGLRRYPPLRRLPHDGRRRTPGPTDSWVTLGAIAGNARIPARHTRHVRHVPAPGTARGAGGAGRRHERGTGRARPRHRLVPRRALRLRRSPSRRRGSGSSASRSSTPS